MLWTYVYKYLWIFAFTFLDYIPKSPRVALLDHMAILGFMGTIILFSIVTVPFTLLTISLCLPTHVFCFCNICTNRCQLFLLCLLSPISFFELYLSFCSFLFILFLLKELCFLSFCLSVLYSGYSVESYGSVLFNFLFHIYCTLNHWEFNFVGCITFVKSMSLLKSFHVSKILVIYLILDTVRIVILNCIQSSNESLFLFSVMLF